MSNNETLVRFGAELLAGRIRIVDLAQTLSADFPALQLPPEFGQVWAFKQETICRYDEKGPGWYWNNFSCGEHSGTHFDAPSHFLEGAGHLSRARAHAGSVRTMARISWRTRSPAQADDEQTR